MRVLLITALLLAISFTACITLKSDKSELIPCSSNVCKISIEDLPNNMAILENFDLSYFSSYINFLKINSCCSAQGLIAKYSIVNGSIKIDNVCYYSVFIFTDKEIAERKFKSIYKLYSESGLNLENFGEEFEVKIGSKRLKFVKFINSMIILISENEEMINNVKKILIKKLTTKY